VTRTLTAPLVSVLLTSYNHAPYVGEALDSLRCQTSRDFEVIITDDASSDGCADVIETWLARTGYPAQFVRNPVNRGICANRNAALARASGTFICSLSADDAYEPERIERQLAYFLQQPASVAAVYSDMSVVDPDGRPRDRSYLESLLQGDPPPQGKLFAHILAGNFIPAPAVMLRRSALATVGDYDERLSFEDFDMWLQLSHRFDFVYLPGVLVRHRILETSLSHSPLWSQQRRRSATQILNKWLGAGLDDATQELLLDQFWKVGKAQLYAHDDASARETLTTVVAVDTRLRRRLPARAIVLPGGCASARLVRTLYRRFRPRVG
jgi:glycosyltransferase involved in cell wall biosynthesis